MTHPGHVFPFKQSDQGMFFLSNKAQGVISKQLMSMIVLQKPIISSVHYFLESAFIEQITTAGS